MAAESSFDIVSKIDLFEVDNAIGQALKEIGTRFDLKGADPEIRREEHVLRLGASDAHKLRSIVEILNLRLAKRGVPLAGLTASAVTTTPTGHAAQTLEIQNGIPGEKAKEIVRRIKDLKLKVQATIQADQVRVKGTRKDDLQAVIQALRETDLGIHMQFTNYR